MCKLIFVMKSGVKKIQIFCIAENTPETYYNMEVMLDLLKLEQLSCVYSLDLKLANILLGLSVSLLHTIDANQKVALVTGGKKTCLGAGLKCFMSKFSI